MGRRRLKGLRQNVWCGAERSYLRIRVEANLELVPQEIAVSAGLVLRRIVHLAGYLTAVGIYSGVGTLHATQYPAV